MSIDPDLLRAFTFIAEEGSFTRAAERVGRTQSAVSMQMQRLEQQLGKALLTRGKGGAVGLTAHGKFLLEQARPLLAMNDSIWNSFQAPEIQGVVRLGTPDDYAFRYLPMMLRRFADSHPGVQVDVHCAPSSELVLQLKSGELDLTLLSEGNEPVRGGLTELWRGPLRWITSERYSQHRMNPLPLALERQDCLWRRAATGSLDRAGIAYRVAYTSETQVGTQAPVMAGLAVTVSTIAWLPEGLRPVRDDEGLPDLPESSIFLAKSRDAVQPITDRLAAHITDTFASEIRRQDRVAA